MSKVKYTPAYANGYDFIVARYVIEEESLCFWGAYDNRDQANRVAAEIGGVVIPND